MMKVHLAVCADNIVRDADTNSLSIFNIIEEIRSDQFPIVLPRIATLLLVERETTDPDELHAEVTFILNQTELGKTELQASFADFLRTRVTVIGSGLPITEPGELMINWHMDNQLVATYKISVIQS